LFALLGDSGTFCVFVVVFFFVGCVGWFFVEGFLGFPWGFCRVGVRTGPYRVGSLVLFFLGLWCLCSLFMVWWNNLSANGGVVLVSEVRRD